MALDDGALVEAVTGNGAAASTRAGSRDWAAGDTPDFLEHIGAVRRYRLQLRRDELGACDGRNLRAKLPVAAWLRTEARCAVWDGMRWSIPRRAASLLPQWPHDGRVFVCSTRPNGSKPRSSAWAALPCMARYPEIVVTRPRSPAVPSLPFPSHCTL